MSVDLQIKRFRWTRISIMICLTVIAMTACRSGQDQTTAADAGPGEAALPADIPAVYQPEDVEILEHCLGELAPYRKEPVGQLVARAGMMFLNTSYVSHTLEREEEVLVVNLRELDCTTFAEYCLAIARTVQHRNPSFPNFLEELQLIRYRDGQLEAYPSRLHYFCDWIYDNAEKGVVKECAAGMGGEPLSKEIHFMSSNPQNYTQIMGDSALIAIIQDQERAINQRNLYYIPENLVGETANLLETGDIVGITTDVDGLAVMHVGILVSINGEIHLLHASSAAGKVLISEETLEGYLSESKRATGIMVARPI